MNFLGTQPVDYTMGKGDLLSHFLRTGAEGYQNRMAPQKLDQEMEGKRYDNTIKGAEAQNAQQMQAAKLAKTLAEAKHFSESSGGGLTGIAQQIHSINKLKNLYGEDSEQYNNAVDAFKLEQQVRKSLLNTRDQNIELNPYKLQTPGAKIEEEIRQAEQGLNPFTKQRIDNPEQQKQLLTALKAERNKQLSNSSAQERAVNAQNVLTTLDSINPDLIGKYSGGPGSIMKKVQQGLSVTGLESKAYKSYEENISALDYLAKQLRYTLKDSVNKSIQQDLKQLLNPESWEKSPKVAVAKFNKVADLIRTEMQRLVKEGNFGEHLKDAKNNTAENKTTAPIQELSNAELDARIDALTKGK